MIKSKAGCAHIPKCSARIQKSVVRSQNRDEGYEKFVLFVCSSGKNTRKKLLLFLRVAGCPAPIRESSGLRNFRQKSIASKKPSYRR